MSKETWLKEHYAVPAELVEPENALAHSLRKWQGLAELELAHHGLDRPPITVDSSTCALCVHFHDRQDEEEEECDNCPIVRVTGQPCDSSREEDESPYTTSLTPYTHWTREKNPWPMISLLQRVLEETGDTSLEAPNPHDTDANSGELLDQDPV